MKHLKQIFIPTLILFLFSTEVFADGYLIRETTYEHNGQQRPALVVTVEPEVSDLTNAWQRHWRSEHSVRLRGRRGNLSAENVKAEAFGEQNFDLFTRMEREQNQTRIHVFAALGYDIYFGDEGQERGFQWLKSELDKFLKAYLTDYYNNQIRDLERTISRAERDMGRVVSSIERSERTHKRNKDQIEKLQKENQRLEKDLSDNRKELSEMERDMNKNSNRLQQLTRQRDAIK